MRRIVELLAPRLTPHERRSLAHDVPASACAYEIYLRGTHVERQRTFDNISMARDLYRQSLDADPDFAPAWARLGRCYRFLQKFDPQGAGDTELTQWALAALLRSTRTCPWRITITPRSKPMPGTRKEPWCGCWGRHPNDPEVFTGLVQATRYCGLLEESLWAHQRARKLDARAVISVAHTYFAMGDYERTLEWYPPGSRFYLDAAVGAAEGREAEAARLLEPRSLLAPLVESLRFCLLGDRARSIEVAVRAIESETPDPEIRFYLARHLVRDGAGRQALETINKLTGEGFFRSTALRNDPCAEAPRAAAGLWRRAGCRAPARGRGQGGIRGGAGRRALPEGGCGRLR